MFDLNSTGKFPGDDPYPTFQTGLVDLFPLDPLSRLRATPNHIQSYVQCDETMIRDIFYIPYILTVVTTMIGSP